MSIGFDRPWWFAAGCLLFPAILFHGRFLKSPFILKIPLGAPGAAPFKPARDIRALLRALGILEALGAFFLLAAAADPQWIERGNVWLSRGADILFVLDISPSMAGIDMDGRSRFDAARILVRGFAQDRPSDAIGLVAVAQEAGLLVPPTVDREALFSRLDSLAVGELGDGTALGLGLAIAGLHIRRSAAPRKAVVLITDGEYNTGAVHPETAAAALGGSGVSLWVIGVGSTGDVPVDYVDPLTRIRRTGMLDSRFNPETLRAIARKGEGFYLSAPSAEAFSAAFRQIHEGELTVAHSGIQRRSRSFRIPVLILALILAGFPRCIRRYLLGAFL